MKGKKNTYLKTFGFKNRPQYCVQHINALVALYTEKIIMSMYMV